MKIPEKFKSMYGWTIIALLSLALITMYARQEISYSFIFAVLLCSILDVIVKKILKKQTEFPYSAFITGLIIGSVGQFNAPIYAILLTCIAAIGSKYLIRLKRRHIFNPAVFGLFVSLAVLGIGNEWWTSVSYGFLGFAVILTPLLAIPNYKAMKLGVSLPFLIVTGILFLLSGIIPFSAGIHTLLLSLPYFFSFIMVSEPKTSPYILKEQIVFGVSLAGLFIVLSIQPLIDPFLGSLIIGNLGYAIYRIIPKKL